MSTPSGGSVPAGPAAWLRMLRSLRRGRLSVRLGLGASALLFIISLGVTLANLSMQYRLEARSQRMSLWLGSHAAVEAAYLNSALQSYLRGVLPAEALREQFELFYSRINLMESGERQVGAGQAERLRALGTALQQRMEVFETDLGRLLAGEQAAAATLQATLDRMQDRLREANGQLHLEQRLAVDTAMGGMRRLQWIFLICASGLMASVLILIVILTLESRRARRSLADAHAAMARQEAAEQTLRALMNSLPAMISAFDPAGRHLFVNEGYARFHGLSEAEVIGHRPEALGLPPGDFARLPQALASSGPLPFQERLMQDRGGQERTLLSTAVAVEDGQGAPVRVVFVALDITDRKEAEERMRYLAEHDGLTGLPNRLLFGRRLGAALDKATSGIAGSFALHGIDLDNFKEVNDSLGHAMGDALLHAATHRIRACLRRGDTLARTGGDEFAVIQAEIGGPEEARRLAVRLVQAMATPFEIDGRLVQSGISVGSVVGLEHGRSVEMLQQRCEIALYRAKAEGRGRAMLFEPAMEEALQERRRLAAELALAMRDEVLTLAYQPKFGLASGRPEGCEALLRWHHPERGPIPPGRFVPVAEEAGMAEAMGRYVLRLACRQIRAWREEGIEVPVAVNLSATLFATDQAVRLVNEALAESGVPPRLIEIELTEGVFLRNAEAARLALEELHRAGVRVSLDDFGTGYSSLGYLQHLRFDVLKVDRTFVQNLHAEHVNSSRQIVDTILRLAHGLGARVVAEGVETAEQLIALRQLGCDSAQGFLLGRPAPAAGITRLYRRLDAA